MLSRVTAKRFGELRSHVEAREIVLTVMRPLARVLRPVRVGTVGSALASVLHEHAMPAHGASPGIEPETPV